MMDLSESDFGSESHKKLEYKGEFYGEIPYYIGIGSWGSFHSEEEEFVEGSLAYLEAISSSCLIQDAIDELKILKFLRNPSWNYLTGRYVIGAPEVFWNLNYKTVKDRCTRRLTPLRIYPEVDSRPALTSAIKLQRDREAIETLFYELKYSLIQRKSFIPLMEAIENVKREEEDDVNLIKELKSNLSYLKDLTVKLEEKRKMDEVEEKEREELMYQLQDELDDVILKCEVEEKFVNSWEIVRKEQNDYRLQMAETYLKSTISKYGTKIRLEKRASHEFQQYLKLCQIELEEELENWMAKYDSEMERRENKILLLKYNRDQAEEKKHQLHKLYEERCREIKEWIHFRELRKLRTGASLVIQSWWRGMMVRKRLGPYKMKKQKKGGGAGEKKRKK